MAWFNLGVVQSDVTAANEFASLPTEFATSGKLGFLRKAICNSNLCLWKFRVCQFATFFEPGANMAKLPAETAFPSFQHTP
jgi:hypothetical protein